MSAEAMERPAKRKKISVACEPCRTRKVRCDGSRPTCTPCADRHNEAGCVYTGNDASYDESRERYIEQLEDRIRELESKASVSGSAPPQLANLGNSYRPAANPGQISAMGVGLARVADNFPTNADPPAVPDHASGVSSHSVPVQSLLEHPTGTSQPSIYTGTPPSLRPPSTPVTHHVPTVIPAKDRNDVLVRLVPQTTEDRLLEVYIEYLHWMYPCLHLPTIIENFSQTSLGHSPGCDPILFQAMLNAIFAAATQVLNEEGAAELAANYFARTKAMLTVDVLGNWSLELLQTLLVSVQYLQSADEPQQCWIVLTTAIRVAQGLGLDLPSTSASVLDESRREVLRRAWYCCTTLDRVIAMSLSRPTLLSPGDSNVITIPQSISPYEAFVASLSLFRRHHDVIQNFYNGHKAGPAPPSFTLDELVTHEQAFAVWEEGLPEKVRFPFDLKPDASAQELLISSFLRERYLQIRIILYRPALSAILHQSDLPSSCFSTQTVRFASLLAASKTCFEAAQAILTTIYDRVQAGRPGRPCSIWWFDLYFAYTASTVILAAKFTPAVSAILNPQEVDLAVHQYTHIFSHHSKRHLSAARCLAALTRIAGSVGRDAHSARQEASASMTDVNPAFNAPKNLDGAQSSAQPSSRNSIAPVDTLDYANWLATVPLDFGSTEWDDLMNSFT